MTTVDLVSAQHRLPELLDAAAHGDDVIITRADGLAFKVVPVSTGVPVFGSAAGLIELRADFDAPLDDFEDYYR